MELILGCTVSSRPAFHIRDPVQSQKTKAQSLYQVIKRLQSYISPTKAVCFQSTKRPWRVKSCLGVQAVCS